MNEKPYKLFCGDALQVMRGFHADSVDAIVTDPPAGISFMSKDWDDDKGGRDHWILWLTEVMTEAIRTLKPGGHALIWALPRTSHWTATAIENAGFEIKDIVNHIFGTGFPKSQNVSKQIDKMKGAEREFVGTTIYGEGHIQKSRKSMGYQGNDPSVDKRFTTAPTTDEAKQWDGWGSALKPAVEFWILAQKPLINTGDCEKLVLEIIKKICQFQSFAQIVKKHFSLKHQEPKKALSIAQWIAGNNTNTQDVLPVVMDMLRLESERNTNLSIVYLWLNILAEIYFQVNTFTTETKTSLITDLKILNSLPLPTTLDYIIKGEINRNGNAANAYSVESLFNVLSLKLQDIQTPTAQENATLQTQLNTNTACEHWILCRKPLSEKTIAANVLKWGTGAINIDGCRVEYQSNDRLRFNEPSGNKNYESNSNINFKNAKTNRISQTPLGRFPANLLHDGSDEVEAEFARFGERTSVGGDKSRKGNTANANCYGIYNAPQSDIREINTGSASRFFYAAKASKRDRNSGLKGQKFDGAELVLCYTCNKEIQVCNEKSLINVERLAHRPKVTDVFQQKVICDCGIQHKSDTDLNTFLFGNESMAKFLKAIKYTIETKTNLITTSQTWNLSAHLHTNENIAAANLLRENGINPAENVELCNTLIITIKEVREFLRGVNRVVSKIQLKIYVKENVSNHPTVKSLALMKYLCRLITPPNGTVLDMFAGSGSTGKAAMIENFKFIGIEQNAEYFEIAKARIEAATQKEPLFAEVSA